LTYAEAAPSRAERYVVKRLSGQESVCLFTHEYDDLMTRPVQLLPVESGTRLIVPYVEDEEPFADSWPILAWALCMDGQVRPILPTGIRRGYTQHSTPAWWASDYIQLPDGSLYEFGIEAEPDRLDSIEAVLAAEIARKRSYDAERAAKVSREAQP
jgi:hypothetical protein